MPELDTSSLPLSGWHLIEASAGTGKTYSIARIFIRLLLEKRIPVNQILVMTFARAATHELRGRIRGLIRNVKENWDTLEEPLFIELRGRVDRTTAMVLLENALLNMDEAAIYTIHGFCNRALTQQAFASRISFSADMETDSRALVLEAVRDWYRIKASSDAYTRLYNNWATPERFANVFNQAIKSTESLVLPKTVDLSEILEKFSLAWRESESNAFQQLNVKPRKTVHTKLQWQQIWELLEEIANGERLIQDSEFMLPQELFKQGLNGAKKPAQLPQTLALYQGILQQQRLLLANLAHEGIDYARNHLIQAKLRLDQMDYDDLITALYISLTSEGGAGLCNLLQAQFPAALVDEFQDTDPNQFGILEKIYSQSNGDKAAPFLCLIGDPKQAIYGFRGGDVFAYLAAREKADYCWDMQANYRSHADVVAAYNRFFYGAPADQDGNDIFGFNIRYQPVAAANATIEPLFDSDYPEAMQWVDFAHFCDDKKGLSASFQRHIANWAASEIIRLCERAEINGAPVVPADIALLVRNKNEAAQLQQALAAYQIPCVYLSLRDNVFKSAEADELLRLLRGIAGLDNPRLMLAALSTTWFGLGVDAFNHLRDDEFQWAEWQLEFTALREIWRSSGLMTMAFKILHQHFLTGESQSERRLTNILHLLELLQQASQTHRQPQALLNWFQQAVDEESSEAAELRLESDENLVRIITMHGAKGLEYPIVILPFVSYGAAAKKNNDLVKRFHQRDNYQARLALLPDDSISRLCLEEEQAETKRLLYVAATRACQRLIIAVAPFTAVANSPLALGLSGAKNYAEIQQQIEAYSQEGIAAVRKIESISTVVVNTQQHEQLDFKSAKFNGFIERDWWLSSFSALSTNARQGGTVVRDRDQQLSSLPYENLRLPLRFRLAKGAEAGNLLHDILEHLDFNQPDFSTAWSMPQQRYAALFSSFEETELASWLTEILDTRLAANFKLSDLKPVKTLRESEFYFPMNALEKNTLQKLSAIVSTHLGVAYEIPGYHALKGMMHGFIDLVFEHDGQFYVADYKSTWLGDSVSDYQRDAMETSMLHSYYHLQYLIYALALHRYLKIRLNDYQAETHFGGVFYLYLRGMSPDSGAGVYFQKISAHTLEQLDALFAGDMQEIFA